MEEQVTQEEQVTTKSVGIKYGLIYGLFGIGYGMILQLAGLATEQWLQWLSFGFMIIVLVFAMREYKEGNQGFMSLGQGLGLGMITIAISTVFSTVFSYIYIKFIDDSLISMTLEKAREELMRNPDFSDAQIEQALAMQEKFMTAEMLMGIGFITAIFFGFLITLVISLIMKRDDPDAY